MQRTPLIDSPWQRYSLETHNHGSQTSLSVPNNWRSTVVSKLAQICKSSSSYSTHHRAYNESRSGPVISPAAKERITGLIASAEEQGGKILLDGRGLEVPAYPNGNFVGPTIIEADTNMKCYTYVISSLLPYHSLNFDDKRGNIRTCPCCRESRLTRRCYRDH